MALACLVAGDRHHHLATEIRPALAAGQLLRRDRYVPSSLVLQRMDGVDLATSSASSTTAPTSPDLAVILNASTSGHQRPAQPGAAALTAASSASPRSRHRVTLCTSDTAAALPGLGWPVCGRRHRPDRPLRPRHDSHRTDPRLARRPAPGAAMTLSRSVAADLQHRQPLGASAPSAS